MILILSDTFDSTTTEVIKWLEYHNKKWIRINTQDPVELRWEGVEIIITTTATEIRLSEVHSFWYRRGIFSIQNKWVTGIPPFDDLQTKELNTIIEFLYYRLTRIRHINTIANATVNKLIVSDFARQLGMLTPEDLLYSDARSLTVQLTDTKSYITKVISGNCLQEFPDFTIYNYTKEVAAPAAHSFFPSLVQNKIEKKYELRIFYLDGRCYTMAIFSQKDNQTTVDFRNYNDEKPNRTVPYRLPTGIAAKIKALMHKLDLNCGSIDMIVTPENEYVFLEVNPIGQFGMVSFPCNYHLDKIIAEYL